MKLLLLDYTDTRQSPKSISQPILLFPCSAFLGTEVFTQMRNEIKEIIIKTREKRRIVFGKLVILCEMRKEKEGKRLSRSGRVRDEAPSFPNLYLLSHSSFSLERTRFLLFCISLIIISIIFILLVFGFMHFNLGRSTLFSDPSALPRSSGGSLLFFSRRLRFALAFLVRSLPLTIRLVFFLLFSVVRLIGILVGRLIVLQFLVLGSLALCLGSAFGGFVL